MDCRKEGRAGEAFSSLLCKTHPPIYATEMYGLYEHNRGDDGFLFAEDGAFSHGPEVIT